MVGSFDELLTTLVDATLAKITLQQNTDMRKISAWVAIVSTPTMIAGIYGMNFEYMPEKDWVYGYPACLLVMLLAGVVLLLMVTMLDLVVEVTGRAWAMVKFERP